MANEINEIEAGARINHPLYRDVYNTTFDKDVIVDFEMEDDGFPTGMCQTENYGWLPVFYHCKKHCYDESVRTLQGNRSLKGGALAFEIEDEVQVLIEEETPKYIVGHFTQHNPPCMCKDIFRINLSNHDSSFHESYFVASAQKVLEDNVDYYGDTPLCERVELVLFEYVNVHSATYYTAGKYSMLRVGPMLYVFCAFEQWYNEETYGYIKIYSYGAWTQEKEDALIVAGQNPTPPGGYSRSITLPEEGRVYLGEFSELIFWEFDLYWSPDGADIRTIKFFGQSDEEE